MNAVVNSSDFARDQHILATQFGIVAPEVSKYIEQSWMGNGTQLAYDAEPGLITTSNAGIPALMTTYISPKVIEVFTTKNRAATIYGEQQMGSWTDETAMFPVVERTGRVSSYGDWNENGSANANASFPQRQSYFFQAITVWGEREMERMALTKIDWVTQKNIATAMTLDKFQNESYFYGISGLQNYGWLNDPSLSAAITPTPKAAGGLTWGSNGAPNAQPTEILFDIQKLFSTLVTQSNGNIDIDDELTLALHPSSVVFLRTPNIYGVTAEKLLRDSFPKIKIETAVEFLSSGTFSCQLLARRILGQDIGCSSFPVKMRAHGIVKELSAWKQKKSGGTWGAIVKQPFGIASMSGI
jgi:hypothetical protein